MVYTVTLNPALDYVMKLKALRTDDINRTDGEEIYYGGKGINVSVILTQLGIPNTALGFLGGFTGKKLEEMLKNDNVSCDFNYLKNGDTRINVKIKADKEIDLNACGPEITKEDMQSFLKKLDSIKSGDYLILAGSIPNTLPDDIYEQILERAGDRNINCVVDATGDLLKNVLKYKPFLIKPNHHELGDLFSVQIKSDDDIVKYSKKLQEMGAKKRACFNGKGRRNAYGRKRKRPQDRQRKGQAHKLRRLRRQYGSRLYGRIYQDRRLLLRFKTRLGVRKRNGLFRKACNP